MTPLSKELLEDSDFGELHEDIETKKFEIKNQVLKTSVTVTKSSQTIHRCEVEPCQSEHALECCFQIYMENDNSNYIIVTNQSYGPVTVIYSIKSKMGFSFDLEPNSLFGTIGNLNIEIKDNRIGVHAMQDSKVILHFDTGSSFIMRPGDRICKGSNVLFECAEVSEDGFWDGDDW